MSVTGTATMMLAEAGDEPARTAMARKVPDRPALAPGTETRSPARALASSGDRSKGVSRSALNDAPTTAPDLSTTCTIWDPETGSGSGTVLLSTMAATALALANAPSSTVRFTVKVSTAYSTTLPRPRATATPVTPTARSLARRLAPCRRSLIGMCPRNPWLQPRGGPGRGPGHGLVVDAGPATCGVGQPAVTKHELVRGWRARLRRPKTSHRAAAMTCP